MSRWFLPERAGACPLPVCLGGRGAEADSHPRRQLLTVARSTQRQSTASHTMHCSHRDGIMRKLSYNLDENLLIKLPIAGAHGNGLEWPKSHCARVGLAHSSRRPPSRVS